MPTDSLHLLTREIANNINQPGKRNFTDPEIKSLVNRALGSIQLGLQSHGVRDVRFEATVTLPAAATSITSSTTPALPTGFIAPIRLWEYQNGNWKDMQQVRDHLPLNADQAEQLIFWEWRDRALRFIGSTNNTQVKIHYRGAVDGVTKPSDTINLPNMNEIVISKASAIGSALAELSTAQYWEDTYRLQFDQFLNVDAKYGQATGFRRKRRRFGLPVWRY